MVPEGTVHDLWNRFLWDRWAELMDASRRFHRIHCLPQEPVARVMEVRRLEDWCSEAIEAYLKAQGVQISHGSIYTIPKTNGLVTGPYKPRRQRAFI